MSPSLIGMGVNLVTGDYSRGASGFWIENGKPTYPVSEVTIAGHLIDMFAALDAGQRSRIPLRHQCADRARGGPHRCRPLIVPSSATTAISLAAAVREAGALALKTFRGHAQELDQGQVVAGQRGRYRGRRAAARAALRRVPGHGWLSEETEDDPRGCKRDAVWIVDPIDGTRAYLAGREDWVVSVALAAAGRPRLAALYAPVTDEFFLAMAGEGATRNGAPIHVGRERARRREAAGPKRLLGSLADPSAVVAVAPGRLAGAAACAGRARRGRRRHRQRQQPRLGPCGSRSFGARSRRRADRFDGEPLIYNCPSRCTARWSPPAGRAMRTVACPHPANAGRNSS